MLAFWKLKIKHTTHKKNKKFFFFFFLGHGDSQLYPLDSTFSIPEFANDITHLLNALNVKKCHFAGHSLGGMIVQQIGWKFCVCFRVVCVVCVFVCVFFSVCHSGNMQIENLHYNL